MNRVIWLLLVLLPGSALAEEGVIYRCTSSSSDVPTLQRTPCATGSKQQVLRIPDPANSQPAAAAPVAAEPASVPVETPAPVPSGPAVAPAAPAKPRRADEGRTIMEAGMVEHAGDDQILDSATLPTARAAATCTSTKPRPAAAS